ncbi:MAG: thioredoxin family protein [candidate division Zixibacteria bacterium]|nr:thioredoxin family protein [candidate division Zixibacteria bacterium]
MIDLGSKNCIPCKKMAPIIDSLKIAYQGKAEIIFIDIKEDKKAARDYGITLIPTQVFIDTLGNEIYRHIGFFPADSITAHIKTMGSQI